MACPWSSGRPVPICTGEAELVGALLPDADRARCDRELDQALAPPGRPGTCGHSATSSRRGGGWCSPASTAARWAATESRLRRVKHRVRERTAGGEGRDQPLPHLSSRGRLAACLTQGRVPSVLMRSCEGVDVSDGSSLGPARLCCPGRWRAGCAPPAGANALRQPTAKELGGRQWRDLRAADRSHGPHAVGQPDRERAVVGIAFAAQRKARRVSGPGPARLPVWSPSRGAG
jgi:hypothetical protein